MASPSLLRRLLAIVYDSLLLVCVLLLASWPVTLLAGDAFTQNKILRTAYQVYLLGVAYLFFAWFWTHGGQTLGMRAWRLRVLQPDQRPITWKQALVRYLGAILSWLCLGLGFIWVFVDKHHRAWHDRLSGTVLTLVPKTGKQ